MQKEPDLTHLFEHGGTLKCTLHRICKCLLPVGDSTVPVVIVGAAPAFKKSDSSSSLASKKSESSTSLSDKDRVRGARGKPDRGKGVCCRRHAMCGSCNVVLVYMFMSKLSGGIPREVSGTAEADATFFL